MIILILKIICASCANILMLNVPDNFITFCTKSIFYVVGHYLQKGDRKEKSRTKLLSVLI